ncbi:MAG: WecB/TagA/CpsF family glycosyltransferase [Xanthomonadaceae bacterium]|nr:WecB/TagA/CpsF family glycosyltransferase [Rhodospirillaceae bacterium]NIA17904.1 WecB/TagA/CpsF family glycosyltransferase [Xanthomonadaceae bacterium]
MKQTKILGVKIDNISKREVMNKLIEYINSDKQHYFTTVNPEFLIMAQKDEEFFNILNKADLSLADGFGIILASFFYRPIIRARICGSDLIKDILNYALQNNQKIFILIWDKGLSDKQEISFQLNKKYPNLKFIIQKTQRNSPIINFEKVNNFNPKIMLIAFGAPYQEKFISRNLSKIPSVKLALGIGGAFDFLTKKTRRAPKFIRAVGMEWFWRLIKHPVRKPVNKFERSKRIFNSVFLFLGLVLKEKFINPFFYRKNVACFLYKKKDNKVKIFLAERKDEQDHWQIPQGGTDNENLKTAGFRELKEEIGTDKFKIKAVFKNVYKYKFNKKIKKYFVKNYKGQKQGLIFAEFKGEDRDINISKYEFSHWKWVNIDEVLEQVHPIRKQAMQKFLNIFRLFNKRKF